MPMIILIMILILILTIILLITLMIGVIDDQFVDINLQTYTQAGKWVVLLFYPFDYTFVSSYNFN